MSNTKSRPDESDEETSNVTEKGQATIPKSKREEHGISAPGRVRFRTNDRGELVVEPVNDISQFRGVGSGEGTDRLLEDRDREKVHDRKKYGHTDE